MQAAHQLPGEDLGTVLGHRGQNLKKAPCCWAFTELRLENKMPEGLLETLESFGSEEPRQESLAGYESHTGSFPWVRPA